MQRVRITLVIPSGAEGGVDESDKIAFLTDPSTSLGVTIKGSCYGLLIYPHEAESAMAF